MRANHNKGRFVRLRTSFFLYATLSVFLSVNVKLISVNNVKLVLFKCKKKQGSIIGMTLKCPAMKAGHTLYALFDS